MEANIKLSKNYWRGTTYYTRKSMSRRRTFLRLSAQKFLLNNNDSSFLVIRGWKFGLIWRKKRPITWHDRSENALQLERDREWRTNRTRSPITFPIRLCGIAVASRSQNEVKSEGARTRRTERTVTKCQ